MMYDASTQARFWAKVDKNGPVPSHRPDLGPCWVWTAATFPDGYAQIRIAGRTRYGNRVSLELALGRPLGPDKQALHNCDNPPCVNNQGHLYEGTHADNMNDRQARGRTSSGDRHFSRTSPELLARGDDNGRRRHPERWPPPGSPRWAEMFAARDLSGEKNGRAKLTAANVLAIRSSTASIGELATTYRVTYALIWQIVKRRIWKSV